MTWTAKIADKFHQNGTLNILVTYTDGIKIVNETYKTVRAKDSNWLKEIVIGKLAALEELDNFDSSLNKGDVDITPPIDKQTEEEKAYIQWRKDYHDLNVLIDLANKEIILSDDARIISLKQKLKNNYLDSYTSQL